MGGHRLPWDLLKANERGLETVECEVAGEVHADAKFRGDVVVAIALGRPVSVVDLRPTTGLVLVSVYLLSLGGAFRRGRRGRPPDAP